jgi:ATP-dependent exoDNAse (exonuclease V) alpha subunit
MAIYHFSVKVISRKQGHSAVEAAAYRTAEKLTDERTGQVADYRKRGTSLLAAAAYRSGGKLAEPLTGDMHDYSQRRSVIHTEILAPSDAPAWVQDRQKLWNAVEKAEKRKDAQLARDLVIALPHELTHEQRVDLLRKFVKAEFVDRGMIADMAIHTPDNDWRNHHAHVMLTMRSISQDGFGKKIREWNASFATGQGEGGRAFAKGTTVLDTWRKAWADHANAALEQHGHEARIDHRSYVELGIDKIPGVHIGKARHKAGDVQSRAHDIANDNHEVAALHGRRAGIDAELLVLRRQRAERDNQTERYDLRPPRKVVPGRGELAWQNQRMTEQNEAAMNAVKLRDSRRRVIIEESEGKLSDGGPRIRSDSQER